ncbi:MAG: D-alanyl-D-alanine carboxypeptidase [Gammaproteobacteria bacterium]|nr:D-alanyl-D-alanine carboxypeptidase [Gammaproteobacteria bacterium]
MNSFKKMYCCIWVFLIFVFQAGIVFAQTQPQSQPASQVAVAPTPTSNPTPMPQPQPMPSLTTVIPAAPDLDVAAYILMDANSGYVIAEKNADARLPPASITKLMTLYLAANALRAEQIHFTDQATISEAAWRMGGSKMFIKIGSTVPVKELIDGIVIASGNDASFAIAEFLGGTEQNFVKQMNQMAATLGMKNTNYTDSNGLPEPRHYSSARDIAILSIAFINNFPEYYTWFKEKWIAYNGIKQPNRNRLLWRDSSVDGIKTGHTDEAGFCLATSAVRNGMRLVSVILGAKSDAARSDYSEALLNYGFRFYESHKLFNANARISEPRVWLGKEKTVALGLAKDFYVTVPVGQYKNLRASAVIADTLKAPFIKGKPYGTLNVMFNDKIIASQPLVALEDNPRTNFIVAFFSYLAMQFHHWL